MGAKYTVESERRKNCVIEFMKEQMLAKVKDAESKLASLKQMVADLVVVDDVDDDFDWDGLVDDLSYQFRWVNQDIQNLYNMFYQHLQGHLPPLNGADQMQKAIDALGLSGDYDVQKKTIYASNGKPEKWVVTMTPKK